MNLVAKSDQSTGNQTYCSYVIQSNDLVFSFTSPYSKQIDQSNTRLPHPGFSTDEANAFFDKHGLAVRAVGVLVDDAEKAFKVAVENGGIGILEPKVLTHEGTGGKTKLAELTLYGDVVLRLISNHGFTGPYLPNFEPVESLPISYGIERLDHAVGNVSSLKDAVNYVCKFTGFHDVCGFTFDEVGTAESGLNGLVLANNNEMVVLPINEPVLGTKCKSQVQTFLELNEGAGIQHLALVCDDIFSTVREIRMRSQIGGFEFMPMPPLSYYKNVRERVRVMLTDKQCKECEELGILIDEDDKGVLLQAFTKSLGDRPTLFIEVIQRIGFMRKSADGQLIHRKECRGFGKANCSGLFKAIEEYEKTLDGTK